MTKKLLIWLASLGGVAILSYSAYRYITKQLELLEASCYKFKNFKFKTLTKKEIAITVTLYVKNLSKIGFIIKNYNFDVLINNNRVANVSKELNQHISANKGVSELEIDIVFDPSKSFTGLEIIKLLKFALLDKDKFKLTFKGFVEVKHSFIQTKQDLDISFTLKEILTDDDATNVNQSPECKIDV